MCFTTNQLKMFVDWKNLTLKFILHLEKENNLLCFCLQVWMQNEGNFACNRTFLASTFITTQVFMTVFETQILNVKPG